MGHRTGSGALVALLLIAGLGALSTPVAADEVCCEASAYSLFLVGESSDGQLTPFAADGVEQHSVILTSAIQAAQEIGTWSVVLSASGNYPAESWSFSIPYKVTNAGGVQLNASVLIEVGGDSHEGSTGPIPALLLPNADFQTFSVDVPIEAGLLAASDRIRLTLQIQTLTFESPAGDSQIEFAWGDQETEAKIDVTLPLLEIDMQEAIVNGRTVHFPVIVRSGFGSRVYTQAESVQFTVGSDRLTDAPVREVIGEGVRLTWTWAVPDGVDSGTFTTRIDIQLQTGASAFVGQFDQSLTLGTSGGGGGGGGGGTGYYPESEPDRTGDSDLEVIVDASLSGDELERETTLRFTGNAALWLRWGMDNIRGDNLSSTSYWRNVGDAGITDTMRHNRVIDSEERTRFNEHLEGSGAALTTFMAQGLGIESAALLGGERIDFVQYDVRLLPTGDQVDTSEVVLIVNTRRLVADGEEVVLLEAFLRDEVPPIWTSVDLDLTFDATALTGVSEVSVDDDGVKVSQRRLILAHQVLISASALEVDDNFRVGLLRSGSPLTSAAGSFAVSLVVLLAGLVLGWMFGKGRSRVPLILMLVLGGAAVLGTYLLAWPIMIVFGAAVAVGLALLLAPLFSSRRDLGFDLGFDEPMAATADTGRRSRRTVDRPAATMAPPEVAQAAPLPVPSRATAANATTAPPIAAQEETFEDWDDEDDAGLGRRRRRQGLDRRRRGTSVPVVDCPRCDTPNPVAAQERPVRIACKGCGTTLKVVD